MTDEQIKGIARAINPHWWNDDIDLLNFTRAVLARAGQKHPSSGESHGDSLKSRDEALRLADDLDAEFVQGRISNHSGRKAATELRRLHEANAELLGTLKHARDLVAEWGAYASDYFQTKYGLTLDLKQLDAAIQRGEKT